MSVDLTPPETASPFATIEEAIEDIRSGRFVVVVDDADRENEGDLTIAAQFVTPESIDVHGDARSRAHLPVPDARALRRARAAADDGPQRDAARNGVHGLDRGARGRLDGHLGPRSRADHPGRDRSRLVAARPRPARATSSRSARKPGGVLQRAGQTEAAVDLARLAGLNPAGVVCEIMNDDGTMARVPDLAAFCERHGLKMVTVADLIEYRRRTEKLVERVVSVRLADRLRRVPGGRVSRAPHRQAARRARQGRRRRCGERPRPRPLRMPDRRRLPLATCATAASSSSRRSRGSRPRAAGSSCTWARRAAASAS